MRTKTDRSIGPYELLELLGQGGMGQVWRARHRLGGQMVALKTLKLTSEGLLRSLRREIHALARLRHPGVVRILEEGLHEGVPWYAMELLEGRTLRRWCAAAAVRQRPMTEAACTEPWWTLSLGPVERLGDSQVKEAGTEMPGAYRASGQASGPGASATLRDLLSLMRRLCVPLAYLHGEGLVHCDLKPDNILVRGSGEDRVPRIGELYRPGSTTPDSRCLGWPVLVDFGLAGQFATLSREALELEAAPSGTVAYMAPEQLRGELLDARADLYALGCIVYELLTGRPPFVGKTPLEVLEQHLRAKPTPPSSLVQALPPELDDLVLRLLEKEPRKRFGYADDVAAALARLGAEVGCDAAQLSDGAAAAGSQPHAYLYRPGFSGREVPLRQLQAMLLRLQEEDVGGVVVLGGESGVGKTRLLMEVGKAATRRSLQVAGGECQASAARPLEALRKPLLAIADRCRARGEQETERLLGRRGKLLALYEPTLGSLPGQGRHPEPAELPADAARQRLYSYLTETFAAFAEERPLVLLLDDLQWADELALAWLMFLSRAMKEGRMPLLLVGAYRTEEIGAFAGTRSLGASGGPIQQRGEAASASSLQRLLESSEVTTIALGRLGEEPVSAIVGDMLALEPAPALFSRFLAGHSEGNPFFVAEYLRAAVEEGLLWRDGQGQWQIAAPAERAASGEADYAALPLPGSIRELVGRRLEGLPAATLRVLEAAAVLGRSAEIALVQEVAHLEHEQLDEALSELLRRQVLEAPGPDLVRFAHDQIREVAQEGLQGERRRTLHRAAAEAIEARQAEARDRPWAALGHHWEQAGEAAPARRCYLAAARDARARYALDKGERLYRAYLRLGQTPTPESVAARNELGEQILRLQGRPREALEEHRLAFEEAREISDRRGEGASLQEMGVVKLNLGQMEEARDFYWRALQIHREVGDQGAEGSCLMKLGILSREQGRVSEAGALHEQALLMHRQRSDRLNEGMVLVNLANVRSQQGQLAEAFALYQQALLVHREVGDRASEGACLANLGNQHREQGQIAEALAAYEQALVLCRSTGNLLTEGVVLNNLMNLHFEQGRPAEALVVSEQALAIHRKVGNLRSEGIVLGNLGRLHQDEGSLEQARALVEQALGLARQMGLRLFEGVWTGELANLERRLGIDPEKSERLAAAGAECVAEVANHFGLGIILCFQGHIAMTQGRSGQPFLQRAQALAAGLDAGPQSQLAKTMARFQRAVEAFEAGEHYRLFRGELIEEMPEGLRRRFIESGELRVEPKRRRGKRQHGKERSATAGEGERRERPRAARTDPSRND